MNKQATGIIDIRGKDYRTVALRVHNFRENTENYGIETEIVSIDETRVIVRAVIKDEYGRILATGHAEETRGRGINATSALENCETSAIGRALAAYGYAGTEFASDNEIEAAKRQIAEQYRHFIATNDGLGLYCYLAGLTTDQKIELHNSWEDGKKSAMKKKATELEAVGVESFAWLKEGIAANDHTKILEGLDGITEGAKQYVWQMLDTHQHATIREALATKE